jgi:hypothetical protein
MQKYVYLFRHYRLVIHPIVYQASCKSNPGSDLFNPVSGSATLIDLCNLKIVLPSVADT